MTVASLCFGKTVEDVLIGDPAATQSVKGAAGGRYRTNERKNRSLFAKEQSENTAYD